MRVITKLKNNTRSNRIFLTIILLGLAVILPNNLVYADTELQFSVEVPPILEITLLDSAGAILGNSTSMEVRPSLISAAFNEKDITINVGTNNEWGYNLIMNVLDINLTSVEGNTINNLPGLDEDPNSPPTGPIGYTCSANNANDCNFTINSWGYKIKQATATRPASNYIPVEHETSLTKTNTLTSSDKTYLSFGSRINAELAPGTYTTTIVFTAVANPDPTPTMQEASYSALASLMPNDGDTVTLRDERDNNRYTITKITDNLYWMIDNLRATGVLSADLSNFSGNDFNVSANSLYDGWDSDDPRSAYDDTRPEYGAYYNYCAASAGTVCGDNDVIDATSDVCPAGWRLPTYDDAMKIANAEGVNRNPIYAGQYSGGALKLADVYADWWTGTNSGDMGHIHYGFRFDKEAWSMNYYGKEQGLSVRCVYGASIDDINELQSFARLDELGKSTTVNSMKLEEIYALFDGRDNERYGVAKLRDGNVWMTDNLRLGAAGLAEELSPENTNMDPETPFILPASSTDFTDVEFNYENPVINTEYASETAIYPSTYVGEMGTYGVYYNFCAASAGTYCHTKGVDGPAKAEYDICPAGWRMPESGELRYGEDEYHNLFLDYDDIYADFINAIRLPLNGSLEGDGGFYDKQGQVGHYWAAMSPNANYASHLSLYDNYLNFSNGGRFNGRGVRCIVK